MARSLEWHDCSEALAQRLRWHIHASKREGSDCSLLIVRPMAHGPRARAAYLQEYPLGALLERLRPLVRRTDLIEVEGEQGIGVVLKGASRDGARAVFHRLREALGRPGGAGEAAYLVAMGYAGSAAEWTDECAVDEAIRAAWNARLLVTAPLPQVQPLASTQPAPTQTEPAGTEKPNNRRQPARVRSGAASHARHNRRGHLWLLSADQSSSPEIEVLRTKARSLGVPYVEIPSRLPLACRKAVAPELAQELRAVPIGRTRGMLTVAMHDPRDASAVKRLGAATGLTIFPVLAASDELERALRQLAPMPPGAS